MAESVRSSIVVRLVSMLAVGAVAAALLVGFFFGGDFGAAFEHVTGLTASSGGDGRLRGTVKTAGSARLDGTCANPAVAENARKGALLDARGRADVRCRELPGADPSAHLALKADAPVEPVVTTNRGQCHAAVQVTWTCLFGTAPR